MKPRDHRRRFVLSQKYRLRFLKCHDAGAHYDRHRAHHGLVAAFTQYPLRGLRHPTTHKTLRGPRGGVIVKRTREEGRLGGLPGAGRPPDARPRQSRRVQRSFKPDSRISKQSSRTPGPRKLRSHGLNLVAGGTDNHLMLIDLRGTGVTGKELQERLDSVHITTNKNGIPYDPEKPWIGSGVRIGTPAATTRGFKEPEMKQIAKLISWAVKDFDNKKADIRKEVQELTDRFPLYPKTEIVTPDEQ